MKKHFTVLLLAVLILSALFAFAGCNDDPADKTPAELPMLSAPGEDIVDADGNTVALRGTNFGGWLVQEGWMCPTAQTDTLSTNMTLYSRFGRERAEALIAAYEESWITEADFAGVKALGLNVVRVPFTYMNVYNYLSDEGELLHPSEFTLREDPFERLDFALEMCKKYELYLILDLHGAVGSQNGNDHSGDTSRTNLYADTELGEAYRAKTAELWSLVAEHFAGESNVAGYDLLNEPTRGKVETENPIFKRQWDYYDVLYDAVRAEDPDHMIFIESTWETQDLPSPESYGWENVVYEYHHYNWTDSNQSNSSFYSFKQLLDSLTPHGVPVLIGEFNAWGDIGRNTGDREQTDLEANAGVLEFYNGEGWHWTTWTYKVVNSLFDIEYSNWGLFYAFTHKYDVTKIYPDMDTYEDILAAWSAVGTAEHFTLYEDFADIVSAAAGAPFAQGEPDGGYSII